jgi:diguanylate cyclase (GGDEF)-like protein
MKLERSFFVESVKVSERWLTWIPTILVAFVAVIYAVTYFAKQQHDQRVGMERQGLALARGIAAIGATAISNNLFLLQSAITAKHRIDDVVSIVVLDPDYMIVASDHPELIGSTLTDRAMTQILDQQEEIALDGRLIDPNNETVIIFEPLFDEPENHTGQPSGSLPLGPSVKRSLVGWIKVDLSLKSTRQDALRLLFQQMSFAAVLLLAALYMIRKAVRRLSHELNASEVRLGLAQRIAKIGNWEWNPKTDAFTVSPELCRLIGIRQQDFPGTLQAFLGAVAPDDRMPVEEGLRKMLVDQGVCDLDHRIRLPNSADFTVHLRAEVVRDETRRIVTIIGTTQDISDRKRSEREIHRLAYYDSLTGLPNRMLFKDRLTQAIAHAMRYQTMLASMFLDLDRFKVINDTLGHSMGDLLLKAVADRLADCVRHSDSIGRGVEPEESHQSSQLARLGGDEFTVLLTNLRDPQDVAIVARRILDELAKPFVLDSREVFITASIGIGVFPSDGAAVDVLLKNADTAMYHAKEQGRNNFQFYSATMNVTAAERLTLENDLRKGLERRELVVYYQPQLNLRTNGIAGAEALVRWRHPQQGIMLPPAFLPMAIETGLVRHIDEEVLLLACRQNKAWQDAGHAPIRMSVNISNSFFHGASLMSTIVNGLQETRLHPKYLELELTESITMRNVETSIAMLQKLRDMGVQLSLDDFGTGYSSLSHLQRFPLNLLKIDQSFVRDLTRNTANVSIASAIIALAHNMKLSVLAEGVETEEQLAILREQGCDEVQGYLFGHPTPGEEFEKLFRQDISHRRIA